MIIVAFTIGVVVGGSIIKSSRRSASGNTYPRYGCYAVTVKRCTGCGEEKPDEDFHFRKKSEGIRIARCRTCAAKWSHNHYKNNRHLYIEKAERWRKATYTRNTEYTISYLRDHPCVDCGEPDIIVLEFHHLVDKKYNVSELMNNKFEVLVAEMEKCEVLCRNCHIRRTAKERNWYKFRADDARMVEHRNGNAE